MAEKGGLPWLKVVAVVSAVALGGSYVWWKQQKAPVVKEVLSGEGVEEVTLMVGSKSPGGDLINLEDLEGIDFPESAVDPRVLMPGSKSGPILVPSKDEAPARQLLPGSKSLSPIFGTRRVEPEEPEP